ncbi:MAG: GguC protein [Cyclobacteriaceae bacterium]
MRLVQLIHPQAKRRIALVEEPNLRLINKFESIYDLAVEAINLGGNITALIDSFKSGDILSYDQIYNGDDQWRLLPAIDHPKDPMRCFLAGTGLTHKASAENRQKMHDAEHGGELTDSMKMYQWGVADGKPESGKIGIQPEWFYKGNGSVLRGHLDDLKVPCYGDDGGEEPEIAGIYLNDQNGKTWRIGFATANEFSDHVMERKNYLYLAPSKIRTCSLGPELNITADFTDIEGRVSVERRGQIIWEKSIKTGENNMAHSLESLEYHHFKYENHSLDDQLNIYFFGADAFSFGDGVALQDEDTMTIEWKGMGRPIRNTLTIDPEKERIVKVKALK